MRIVLFVLITFQFASTALTVTVKPAPAVCAFGEPVLPLVVPGTDDSPGTSNCSFAKAAALMIIPDWVPVIEPVVVSVAVKERVPTVLNVALKVCAPTSALVKV